MFNPHSIPRAERMLSVGNMARTAGAVVCDSLIIFGHVMGGMKALTPRQQRAAEFSMLETVLQDETFRKTFEQEGWEKVLPDA